MSEGQGQDGSSKELGVNANTASSQTNVPILEVETTQIKGTISQTSVLNVNVETMQRKEGGQKDKDKMDPARSWCECKHNKYPNHCSHPGG